MRTRTLVALVAVSLSIGAAQGQITKPAAPAKATSKLSGEALFKKKYPKGTLCNDVVCTELLVKVTAGPAGSKQCKISPVDALGMKQGFKNTITWTIDPAGGATFAADGIKPKSLNAAAWNKEFDKEKPGDTKYIWSDNNPYDPAGAGNRTHKYNIKAEIAAKGQKCHLDPIIINDVHN